MLKGKNMVKGEIIKIHIEDKEPSLDKCLNDGQIKKLQDYFADKKAGYPQNKIPARLAINEMIVELFLNADLRTAELCNLQMRDLPGYHGKIAINVRGVKDCIQRSVVISKALADRLQSFTKRFHKHSKPQYFLFMNERYTGPISPASTRSKLRVIGQAIGIISLNPRRLRHTHVSQLYKRSRDLRQQYVNEFNL